ncbi:MAG: hypothetical protein JXR83_13370 [Deltaproteobacteria bacterium]|nr:hypothetical protein [Deltaproteobacteria bacterium]
MSGRLPRSASLALLLPALALIGGAHFLRAEIGEYRQPGETLTPPNPTLVAVLALGDRTLAADLVWIDAVQYFGGTEGSKYRYALLSAMLNTVIEFDPAFRYAYKFGGMALTTTLDGVEAADALLELGHQRFADDWVFLAYIGFNAMLYREDYLRAAEFFGRAAKYPDAPAYVEMLATRLAVEAGDCKRSLHLIDALLQIRQDKLLRQRLLDRRDYVIWECNFQLIEEAAKLFAERNGRPARALDELVAAGLLAGGVPPHPYGGRYLIDGNGKVASDPPRKRLRLKLNQQAVEQLKRW